MAEVSAQRPVDTDNDAVKLILDGYRTEAFAAREGGENPRDAKWREHLDLYWNRYDFSQKANWQSKTVMPEVPQYVDRFSSAMTDALMTTPRFFTVTNPADKEDDLTEAIAKLMDVWLWNCGRAPDGSVIGYDAVFDETIKLGSMMMASQVVSPRVDMHTGEEYVGIETVDPRRLWLDHTRRNLYRMHRQEIDMHELMRLARKKDSKGKQLYDTEAVERLVATVLGTLEDDQQRLTGSGVQQTSHRKPIVLDEYLCTLLSPDGKELQRNALCVMANETEIIRGPEKNPFWHGRDWIVSTPLIQVPLSVYGRAYMEDFGPLSRLYVELTNMIVDAVYTSSLKAFTMMPDMLQDPNQADEGLYPNVTFRIDAGLGRAEDFLKEVNLGAISPDAVRVWQMVKTELETAAMLSDILRGQFAPKGRTSAQEIETVEENAGAMLRAAARNTERRLLEPVLDRVWRTGLQLMKPDDPALIAAVGKDMLRAIHSRRKQFAKEPFVFRVRAISGLIARNQRLRALVQTIAVITRSPDIMQAFAAKYSMDRLVDILLELHGIDKNDLKLSEREQLVAQVQQSGQLQEQLAAAQAGQQPGAGAPQGPRPLSQTAGASGQVGRPTQPAGT